MPRLKKVVESLNQNSNSAKQEGILLRPLTLDDFVVSTVLGCALLLGLIFIAVASTSVSYFVTQMQKQNSEKLGNSPIFSKEVVYSADKKTYLLNDTINLKIINYTDKPIYLSPCQYFNKFEKKINNTWKEIPLLYSCNTASVAGADTFDRSNRQTGENIAASSLGEGVWRGVSEVFFDCQKKENIRCKNSKMVYSGEFTINKRAQ